MEERHIFIVRIWCEPRDMLQASLHWRGLIEHPMSSNKHYFDELGDIPLFVLPYLKQMGIVPSKWWRLFNWLFGGD
jgi:hypothetical protein